MGWALGQAAVEGPGGRRFGCLDRWDGRWARRPLKGQAVVVLVVWIDGMGVTRIRASLSSHKGKLKIDKRIACPPVQNCLAPPSLGHILRGNSEPGLGQFCTGGRQ